MVLQAVIDIDVEPSFGLAKSLRICTQCGLKNIVSDSVKRVIHIVITENIEEIIRCLSTIKGFFVIDLRLLLELCSYDNNFLKKLGVIPIPKALSKQSRILGYTYINNTLYVFEKTSKKGVVLARMLKTKNIPTFIEPSHYLIQATNENLLEKVLHSLNALRSLESRLKPLITRICVEGDVAKTDTFG